MGKSFEKIMHIHEIESLLDVVCLSCFKALAVERK